LVKVNKLKGLLKCDLFSHRGDWLLRVL
jgi:hypothetical protein